MKKILIGIGAIVIVGIGFWIVFRNTSLDADNTLNNFETLVHLEGVNNNILMVDQVEYVDIPSDRATELGIKNTGGVGTIYNEEIKTEEFSISDDCVIKVYDDNTDWKWETLSVKEFAENYEKYDSCGNYYDISIENNLVTEIVTRYMP